jgi:hypothetical protein
MASTADIQHVKPGYPVSDPLKASLKNTIFSAISQVEEHEEGIDIVCKAEREVAKAMGFSEDDFGPGGKFGSYSQECDYKPSDSTWIIVDKDDPTKIVKEVSYQDGLDLGFKISHVGANGDWNYFKVDGNPVYVRIRPLSFSGVGHVITPADESAEIYKLAASLDSCRQLAGFYPGMDDAGGPVPHDMLGDVGSGADLGPYAVDFLNNPDLRTASLDKFTNKDQEDPKAPDDHFAACWSDLDYSNTKDGKPAARTNRLFRIKNEKGELDRNRLVVAYHAIAGLRGNTTLGQNMPPAVRAHALDLVRQGLKSTKPKQSKENSAHVDINTEIEALKGKEKELSDAKTGLETELNTVKTELASVKTEHEKALSTKDTEIADLKAKVEEYQAKEVASQRLSKLDEILPFSDDEKKADTFADFTKSLATLTEDGMQIAVLQRQLAKAEAARATSEKNLSGHGSQANPALVDPTRPFDAEKALAAVEGDIKPKTAIGFLI